MIYLVLFGVALVLVFAIAVANESAKQKAAKERSASISKRWPMDELYVSAVDQSTVGVNFADKRLVLGVGDRVKPYGFAQVSSVEVVENGATTSTTNRGSQLAGAAIGGLALGGVGALIGGLSGSRTTHQRVTAVALKVTVEDRYEPVHVVTFLRAGGGGVEPGVAEPARQAAARVHAHLVNAMRQVARESAGQQAALGGADQLAKLWDMRQAGALTAEEFDGQKALLLAGGGAAAALPAPDAGGRRYMVMLVHPGPHARRFADALVREVPELPVKQAMRLKSSLPATLLRDVGETRARKVQAALQEVGAQVDVV